MTTKGNKQEKAKQRVSVKVLQVCPSERAARSVSVRTTSSTVVGLRGHDARLTAVGGLVFAVTNVYAEVTSIRGDNGTRRGRHTDVPSTAVTLFRLHLLVYQPERMLSRTVSTSVPLRRGR